MSVIAQNSEAANCDESSILLSASESAGHLKGYFWGFEAAAGSTKGHRLLIRRAGGETGKDAERVLKEIKLVSRLDSEHLLCFSKSFARDGSIYKFAPIRVESLEIVGHLLETTYTSGLPEQAISRILKGVLSALEYLHANSIIHRAVRANSIFITPEGAKLSGFEHAINIFECNRWIGVDDRVQQFDDNLSDVFVWLAPEVLKQDLQGYGVSSDIYSVGICLCEIGNGFAPFQEMEPLQILYEKLRGSTPFLLDSTTVAADGQHFTNQKRTFSKSLHRIIAECLSYGADERPSAKQLLSGHSPYLDQTPRDSLAKFINRSK